MVSCQVLISGDIPAVVVIVVTKNGFMINWSACHWWIMTQIGWWCEGGEADAQEDPCSAGRHCQQDFWRWQSGSVVEPTSDLLTAVNLEVWWGMNSLLNLISIHFYTLLELWNGSMLWVNERLVWCSHWAANPPRNRVRRTGAMIRASRGCETHSFAEWNRWLEMVVTSGIY